MTTAILSLTFLFAFNPPAEEKDGIRLSLEAGKISRRGKLKCVVENRTDSTAEAVVTLSPAPPWEVRPGNVLKLKVAPRSTGTATVELIASGTVFPEFYGLHAKGEFQTGGRTLSLAPVLVFKPEVPWPRRPTPERKPLTVAVPPAGGSLVDLGIQEISFVDFRNPAEIHKLPSGWTGSEESTGCQFSAPVFVNRGGETRPAAAFHPPWRKGPGRIFIDYRLRLPSDPMRLRFAVAIRDNTEKEPPSDGVTFRILARTDSKWKTLFSRHTKSKKWERHTCDLAPFAGKEIVLRLVGDPGPKKNTTCDQGFFADVALEGPGKPQVSRSETEELGIPGPEGWKLSIERGGLGIFDSLFRFENPQASIAFKGFDGRFLLPDERIVNPRWFLRGVEWSRTGQQIVVRHRLLVRGVITATVRPLPHGVQVALKAEGGEIVEAGPGPFDKRAGRVYAGDGNVIVEPESFRLHADGHRLSTRFAAFDFPGLSFLAATDTLPEYLEVVPSSGIYRLVMGEDPVFTFIPTTGSAFQAALKYRETVNVEPAGGVGALRGRFVFDLWGGRYRESALLLEKAAARGLKHSLVVWHNWQRWGYDYRLPEIFPPNPALGTLDDFRFLARTCRKHGILFAPHDNYIDVYPDFPRFSYDLVCMNRGGRPIRAWFNRGRNAQSYRFRPDRFAPFMKENVSVLAEEIAPTAYFIDVFSSISPFAYYDRTGRRRRRRDTVRMWAEAFDWIREKLGGAPQVSESGHDALIGSLDGAQANHLRVDATAKGWATWKIACRDSERIPWFDIVWHDKFVLHGAGYPIRFAGGLPLREHGWASDDYMSIEAMTGHPGMVSRPFGRDVVRKYYLWHDFSEAIGLVPITGVEFVEDDIHRQKITYRNGAVVWVNRSKRDFTVTPPGRSLLEEVRIPPRGFFAWSALREAAIAKAGGRTVEWSRGPGYLYVNARRRGAEDREEADFEFLRTTGAFRLEVGKNVWNVTPLPESGSFTILFPRSSLPAPVEAAEAVDEAGEPLEGVEIRAEKNAFRILVPEGALWSSLRFGEKR